MMKEIVLASFNNGKLKEFERRLKPLGFRLRSLAEFCDHGPEETATTFVENALLKARFAAKLTGLPALADDSGLCVSALNGAPGVRSARYAGDSADSDMNISRLLNAMQNFEGDERRAMFFSVLVLMRDAVDPMPLVVSGMWHGYIASQVRGHGGFGYDPIFYLPELQKMASELSIEEKNLISHRGLAMNELIKPLKD